jgi:hypothetical protein
LLIEHVDVDWLSDINDHKSTSSFIFSLAGAAVSWSSKKQTSVALSSMEAEYITRVHTAKEAVWLRHLLTKLRSSQDSLTPLYIDNQSMFAIAQNPEFYNRTKHIEVQHHFLCQVMEKGEVNLTYMPTGEQMADTMTKGLSQEKHEHFAMAMGLRH